jgi:hypothetical protein
MYKRGDKVWLDARDIKTTRPAKKLDDKWFGPFQILDKVNDNAYRLKLPTHFLIHPVFHVSKLRAHQEGDFPGRQPSSRPAPVVIRDGTPQYELERIEDSRLHRGKLQYLVKWMGYPVSESTWEPANIIKNDAPKAVRDFHRRNPSAPQRISALTFQRLPFRPYENLTEAPKRVLFDWTSGRWGAKD